MGQDLLNWLTIREVAKRLEVSTQYVSQQLIEKQRLRAIKTKLGWLVDPASVEAFETARKPRKGHPKAAKSPD